jgi:lysozyme family protein
VGAAADGSIGPGTLRKVAEMPADLIVSKYQQTRLEFLKELPTWDTFGRGWGRRVMDVATTAGKISRGEPSSLA